MSAIVIKDFDTALDAIIEKFADPKFDSFELAPDTNIQIKLEGAQWDGKLDYKVAEFIVKLQKSLLTIYNAQTGEGVKYNSQLMEAEGLRVTVKVERGCTLFNIDLAGWWKNMESKHQLAAVVIVGGLFAGAYCGVSVHGNITQRDIAAITAKAEVEKKIQERIQDENRQKTVRDTVEKVLDVAEKSNHYMAFLASKMQKNDKMHIDGVTLPANEAKKIFKRTTVPDGDIAESRHFVDGEYVVTAINREKDVATIRFSDKKRSISLKWLSAPVLEEFYKRCAQRKTGDTLPPLPLQLTAIFQGGVFKQGFIHGIGKPREGTMTFQEASLASASEAEDESAAQMDED